ncbi:MAG: hypothetical protein AB1796_02700 [Bacillota bacterium]
MPENLVGPGWRARLGVIVPSPNPIIECDLINYLPDGVSVHFSRARTPGDVLSLELLEEMSEQVIIEAEKLILSKVSVIGYGCTSGSFYKENYDKVLCNEISAKLNGVPVTTATTAVLNALKVLGVINISFCSPYEEIIHKKGVNYFIKEGYTVSGDAWLGLKGGEEIAYVNEKDIYELALRADCRDSQAIFLSCTGFPAMKAINLIETDLNKPVISSNQCLLWHMLKLSGVKKAKGPGKLFALDTNVDA